MNICITSENCQIVRKRHSYDFPCLCHCTKLRQMTPENAIKKEKFIEMALVCPIDEFWSLQKVKNEQKKLLNYHGLLKQKITPFTSS